MKKPVEKGQNGKGAWRGRGEDSGGARLLKKKKKEVGRGGGVGGGWGRGGGGGRRGGGNFAGGGLVGGEILSTEEKSLTLKLRDGGSRLVFFSSGTQILKSATGTIKDFVPGEQVVVTGAENTDGSITAQSIQLRPFMASSTRNR